MAAEASRVKVDVIIAVHQLNRPIERAVRSAFRSAAVGQARVIVVCHGIESDAVRQLIGSSDHENLVLVDFTDGIPSAAGPYNAGLAAAEADYVSFLGSDDMLDGGALSSWLAAAERTGADAVIAPLRMQSGPVVLTPRARPWRQSNLHPVRDRLSYRTAPLGLLRLSTVRRLGLKMTPGMRTGEDIDFGLAMWFRSQRVELGEPCMSYVIGEDAVERVTGQVLPLNDEFAAMHKFLAAGWAQNLSPASKRAIAIKLTRIHVLGALVRRGSAFEWSASDLKALRHMLTSLVRFAPGMDRPFSTKDRRLLDVGMGAKSSAELNAAIAQRDSSGYLAGLLTPNLADNFRRESNLRYYAEQKAYALVPRRAAEM